MASEDMNSFTIESSLVSCVLLPSFYESYLQVFLYLLSLVYVF